MGRPRTKPELTAIAKPELDAWVDYLRAEVRPKTLEGYRSEVEKLLTANPDTRFADFTQTDIERYLDGIDEKYRAKSASHIRGWFRWGEQTGQIVDLQNPMRHLQKYKWVRSGPVRERFTDSEVAQLTGLPHPDGVLMEILFETGIKTGEVRTLMGKSWEFDVPQLRITEGVSPRVVPIVDRAFLERVARMLQVEKIGLNDYVWYTHRGGSRERKHDREPSAGAVHTWWTQCLKTAGVQHRMMRTARNTFARRMQDQGMPLSDLGIWLGHNDYYTTSEYYAEDRLPEAVQRVTSLRDATEVIRHQRELLQRVLPHLLTPGAPGAIELAREISAELTNQGNGTPS
jgi:site-specific recombinase XerD